MRSATVTRACYRTETELVVRQAHPERLHSPRPRLPGSAAHLDPNRRAGESKLLSKLIDEEALVRKMKRRRHVREEDELRRRDADLGGVQDAHVRAAGTDGWIRRGHRLDELVQR